MSYHIQNRLNSDATNLFISWDVQICTNEMTVDPTMTKMGITEESMRDEFDT